MYEASRITHGFPDGRDLGSFAVGLFPLPFQLPLPLPFQLPLASLGKLLPGFSHLLELLAMSGRGGSRHLSTFGGMQKILVDLLQAEVPANLSTVQGKTSCARAGMKRPCRR